MLKKTFNAVWDRWPYILMFTVAIAVITALFGYKLTSLVGGVSSAEIETAGQIDLHKIVANPLDLPYKLTALGLSKFFNIFTALRLTSALFATLFVWFFYAALCSWQTRRISILGTLLFVSSTWLLHAARTGTTSITLLSALALLAYGSWALKTKKFVLSLLGALVAFGLNIYAPAMVWFIVIMVALQHSRILEIFKRVKLPFKIISVILLCMIITPLIYGFINDPSLMRVWLGLPHTFPDVYSYFNNLIQIPIDLYVSFQGSADSWLSGVPLLDIFAGTMMLMGLYAYFFILKLDRAKIVIGSIIVSALLVALGGVYIILLMPYLYFAMTAGFALMMQQWFTVFPRNPLARGLALSLIIILVSLSTFYQLDRYFIAWPNAPQTKAAFVQKPNP